MNYPSDKTVLIVNDAPEQLETMQATLLQAGFQVLTALDIHEGLKIINEKQLDLVITMTSGIKMSRLIRAEEKFHSLPILLVGGLSKDVGSIVEGLEVGADDYIEMPADPLYLNARAARLIERKRMHDVLQESERYFRSLIENISDIISILTVDGTILYESPSVEQILGYQPEELIGKDAFDFVHTDDVEKIILYFKKAVENSETAVIGEYRFKHKTDSWRILESLGKVINDPSRGTVVVITSRDVTEQRKAENARREIEDRYRIVAESASDVIITIDKRSLILFVNPAAEKVLGYKPEELIGNNLEIIIPVCFRAAHNAGMQRYLQSRERHLPWSGMELRALRRDGREIQIEISFGEYHENDKYFFTAIIRDITERKRAEQSLRESEENFRALVLATTQHVWTLKENDENENLSRWWMNLTGQTFEKLQVAHWLAAIHPEDREIANAVWQNEFANKILFNISYRVRIKTGEYRHYAVRGVPIFNADGSFRQWIGTFNDITDQKQAEEALLKSQEQLRLSQKLESVGRLAGGIAHDFNNMLTAINGYSELTLRKLEADNPLRRNIEEIKKAGERSALLTHQLLAFSRKQVLQSKILDLNEVITDTAKMLERLIGEDIRLETILDAELGHITGDPGQLTQVIMNLAINARDAMPQGGSLIIETANIFLDEEYAAQHVPTKPGSYVMLTVTDTGSGMDDETQKNIFEPFYTTKETGKGTGLGLATVYGIIKQSGGFIWVDSKIGVGSTFNIYLPCINAEAQFRNEVDTFAHTAKKVATILIVDDEDSMRALTRRALEECGYKVIEASSGSEALEMCLQQNCAIELVITDVMMPQMGGRELAERLAKTYPQLRVLFTSGYTDELAIRLDIIETDTNFIQKPFTFDALAQKVRESLNSKN